MNRIGIIGGTSISRTLASSLFKDGTLRVQKVTTPFGNAPLLVGTTKNGNREAVFVERHGQVGAKVHVHELSAQLVWTGPCAGAPRDKLPCKRWVISFCGV